MFDALALDGDIFFWLGIAAAVVSVGLVFRGLFRGRSKSRNFETHSRGPGGSSFEKSRRDVSETPQSRPAPAPAPELSRSRDGRADWHTQEVQCTAFARSLYKNGEDYLVRVALHTEAQRDQVTELARNALPDAYAPDTVELSERLKIGETVTVVLRIGMLQQEEQITWNGRPVFARFSLRPEVQAGPFTCTVVILRNGLPIATCEWSAKTEDKTSEADDTETRSTPINSAFISYSQKDQNQMRLAVGTAEAFRQRAIYDAVLLRGGDEMRPKLKKTIETVDLFILLWSKNSHASEWCQWETDTAIGRYDATESSQPLLYFMIIEDDPPTAPAAWMDRFLFQDPLSRRGIQVTQPS